MTVLAAPVLAEQGWIDVDTPLPAPHRYPYRVVVDSEVMLVTGGLTGTRWLVDRGAGGERAVGP